METRRNESAASPESAEQPTQEQQAGAGIDIQQLAEKVYRLLLADLRLEQARGARRKERL